MGSIGWLVLVVLGFIQVAVGAVGWLSNTQIREITTVTQREVAIIDKGKVLYKTTDEVGSMAHRFLIHKQLHNIKE